MTVLYLHIGSGKTGSSALQLFLLENRLILSRLGFEYPEHELDINLISSGNGRIYCDKSVRDNKTGAKKFTKKMLEKSNKNIVISSEYFYSTNPDDIKDLLPQKQTIVIVYLRRQDSWAHSMYNQTVKNHFQILSANEWLEGLTISRQDLPYYLSYQTLYEWSRIYGNDKIIVKPYEKQQFVEGNIFSDFLNVLGIEFSHEFKFPDRRINNSYAKHATEYKRLNNLLSLKGVPLGIFLQKYSDTIKKKDDWPYEFISPIEELNFVERFNESNARIAMDFLGREDGQLFFEPLPDPNEPWEPYPGLSEEKVIEITSFIAEHSPDVIPVLTNGIFQGLTSDEPNVREAAETLFPALKFDKKLHGKLKGLQKDSQEKNQIQDLKSQNENLQQYLKNLQKDNERKDKIIIALQNKVESLRNKLNNQSRIILPQQKGLKSRLRVMKHIWIVKKSGLLYADWYLETYPDVAKNDIDPVKHYIVHGWREGRNPSQNFNTNAYLTKHPDVTAAGICPLIHFILHGKEEGIFLT